MKGVINFFKSMFGVSTDKFVVLKRENGTLFWMVDTGNYHGYTLIHKGKSIAEMEAKIEEIQQSKRQIHGLHI